MEHFTLRLYKVHIIDNREIFGTGEMGLLSFITSEDLPLPKLNKYFDETDPIEKARLLKESAKGVISSKELGRVDHVRDGHDLIFGDTGYSLWTSSKVPTSFNWQMTLFECDQGVRNLGQQIDGILHEPEFDSFLMNVAKLAAFGANPTVTLSIEVGKYVIGKVAEQMLKNRDDQVGVVRQSFWEDLDYPGLRREAQNIPDLSGNIRYDYSIFGSRS